MLDHGGNLNHAIEHYGIAREHWLDLSTGINPVHYPAPPLPADIWHSLPQPAAALTAAACAYYQVPDLLPVAGSQAAIQALPQLRLRSHGAARVVMATPAYAEHAHRWRLAGHQVEQVAYQQLAEAVDHCDVLLLCNPNNPSGAQVAPGALLDWAQRLSARGGWLVVDEAFGDVTPQLSVAAQAVEQDGLIVLRSLGKFFGLAGVRLGFVVAAAELLSAMQEWLGPWAISSAAQEIGIAALRDVAWQSATRQRLLADGERLQRLLAEAGIVASGCALFQWWPQQDAALMHDWLARQGIWLRLFAPEPAALRCGLPATEEQWQRLQSALQGWQQSPQSAQLQPARIA